MPRIRTIKPSFWLDQRIATRLTRDQRLLYIGLWNQADDEGRFVASPRLLLGVIFPYDTDLDESFIRSSLDALAECGRVVLYTADGEEYGEIVNWHRHQRINRPAPSVIPSSGNTLSTIHGAISEPSRSPHGSLSDGRGREGEVEEEETTCVEPRFEYPEPFQVVWAIHHRGPKRQAYDAYRKAVANGITHDGLVEALRAYKRTLRDDFLGVHLFRWIRDERWQEQSCLDDDDGNGVPLPGGGFYVGR